MRWLVLALAVAAIVVAGGPQTAAAQATGSEDPASVPRTPWGDPDLQGLWNHGTITPLQRPEEYGRSRVADRGRDSGRQPRLRDAGAFRAEERADPRAGRCSRLQPVLVGPRHLRRPDRAPHGSGGRPAASADGRTTGVRGVPPKRSGGGRPDADGGRRSGRRTWIWATAAWSIATCQSPRAATTTTSTSCSRRATSPSSRSRFTTSAYHPGLRSARAARSGPAVARCLARGTGMATRSSSRRRTSMPRPTISGRGPNRRVVERFRRRGEDAIEYSFTVTDPERLDPGVERDGAVAPGRGADFRVCLSRGQLRHDQSPHVVTGGRSGPVRDGGQ